MRGDRAPGRGWPSPGPRLAAAVAVAALGLLAVVALASATSPLRVGTGAGTPRHPTAVVEYLVLATLIGALLGLLLLVSVRGAPGQLGRMPRQHPLVGLAFVVGVMLLAWGWSLLRQRFGGPGGPAPLFPETPPEPATDPVVVRLEWTPVVVTLAAVLTGLVLAIVFWLPGRRPPPAARARRAAALAELVEATLADVHAEPDPRRAVIAAWARMEHGLAAAGLPRHPAETPFELVARALEQAGVPAAPARRLAGLFEQAGFSLHPVDRSMRDEAVAALTEVSLWLATPAEADPDGAGQGTRSVTG